jgi:release factor glutamine methyltransferase
VTTTVKRACHQASQTLAACAIDDAPLEAELLLMHVLGIDRAHLYIRLEGELLPDDEQALDRLIDRRLSREPMSYITGHREFFGEEFHVAPGVLIPRPESELLVEEALRLVECRRPDNSHYTQRFKEVETSVEELPAGCKPVALEEVQRIADIGTGCGAIAISLALRLPWATVYATDISPRALEIAAINCHRHGVQVHLLEGDLLNPLPEPVDIIIANLPYVRDEELGELGAEIRVYEPRLALAGGLDGLDKVRQLLADAPRKLRPGGVVLIEIAPAQGPVLTSWLKSLFPDASVELLADLSGVARVLKVVMTGHRVQI